MSEYNNKNYLGTISLKEFSRREDAYAEDLAPEDGFMIRPIRALKTNARTATKLMKMVHRGEMREKDAVLVMIPWIRAAIDIASDTMSIEEIQKITEIASAKYRRFLFSANSLTHVFAKKTLERSMPPRHVECTVDDWINYRKANCSKKHVPIFAPNDSIVIYRSLMLLTDAVIKGSWVGNMMIKEGIEECFEKE